MRGPLFRTRTGETTVRVESFELLAKSLRPLPFGKEEVIDGEIVRHSGFNDPEQRYRQRYADLAVHPEVRAVFMARSRMITAIRTFLDGLGFMEVETPVLQPLYGGAAARPFSTHHNALDMPLFLRIADELYLKRLVVGGIDRVYEIGRNFRNEGVDSTHSPEFTMLEAYEAYGDYNSMAELTQRLIVNATNDAIGGTVIRRGDEEFDIGGEWRTVTVNNGLSEALGAEITADTPLADLLTLCQKADINLDPAWNRGQVILEMYEHLLEDRTVLPTFYRDFPTEVSPLTRAHRVEERLAERWDLVAFGTEIGTAYSELIDPVEQRARFTAQSLLAAGGDAEAMQLDEDFLRALEYAMPPTGGMGMGVDRLLMMMTGASIRQSVLFPFVRPE